MTPRVCHTLYDMHNGRLMRRSTMSAAVSESQDIEQATAAIQCAVSSISPLPSSPHPQTTRQQDQAVRSPTSVSPRHFLPE